MATIQQLYPKSQRFISVAISPQCYFSGRRKTFHLPSIRRRYTRQHCRYITSSDTTNKAAATDATVTENDVDNSNLAAKLIKPKPLFPWRHSPHPLPRLTRPRPTSRRGDSETAVDEENPYETDYYTKGGPLGQGWPSPMDPWLRAVLQASSMHLLGMSWFSVAMPWSRKDWIEEMEAAFCDAFAKGVNGMIIDTYSLEDQDVISSENEKSNSKSDNKKSNDDGTETNHESFDVDFEHTMDPNPLKEKASDDTKNSIETDSEKPYDEEQEQNAMLEQSLRKLYQSARRHSHPSKINILLRTQPQSASIESMFPIYGLSRTLVRNHPNLRHSYRNLAMNMQRKQREAMAEGRRLSPIEIGRYTTNGLYELLKRSAKLSSDGMGVITIIAQVSIRCREIFCVKDVESGEILQGHGDGRERDVTHLVRFEIVVKDPPEPMADGDWGMVIGRWQITDWDDLLDGNVWFT
ncbi:hypothetical protein ACHAW6_009436 [Cyclotella cf. meneghiniana]